MGWKGLKRTPQGTAHYHHREGLSDYVLVNGPFQLTSSSIVLSSHNELPPAGFLVNDYIHYSSRISVIIDFVQTVRIPQCVLNPIPKRCWTLSHLIRLQESAALRQLLQLLHYMLDNCWPILGIIHWHVAAMTACSNMCMKPNRGQLEWHTTYETCFAAACQ